MLCFKCLVGSCSLVTATPSDVTEYFPEVKGNLTKVTWAHAVNNLTLLEEALKGNTIRLVLYSLVFQNSQPVLNL